MDIKTCRNCGKIFQFRGVYTCPECIREIDDLFVKVRDYIYRNPRANIDSICEDTGANSEMVMDWLREGRLIASEHSTPLLGCTKCGAPIVTGQLCVKCANAFKSEVNSASKSMNEEIKRQAEAAERRGLHIDSISIKK